MAKKKRRVVSKSKGTQDLYWHFIVPCVIGGAIAWFFTGSMMLAVMVLLAVLIGNYVGYEIVKKK